MTPFDPPPTYPMLNQPTPKAENAERELNLLHISLRYKPNAASGLLAVHEQPTIFVVVCMENFVFFNGQLPGTCGIIVVECFDDRCMLELRNRQISDDERNATQDQIRTCSTYAAGTSPTGALSSCFGLTFHQLQKVARGQMECVRWMLGERVLNSSSIRSMRKRTWFSLISSSSSASG